MTDFALKDLGNQYRVSYYDHPIGYAMKGNPKTSKHVMELIYRELISRALAKSKFMGEVLLGVELDAARKHCREEAAMIFMELAKKGGD